MIYLDAASTAKYTNADDIIVNTMTTAMRDSWMNPSSLYAASVKSKIEKCRANIADFIGAKPEEIYFTSGASEANNWCIRGWVDAKLEKNLHMLNVITTPIEHKSMLDAVKNKNLCACTYYCDVDEYGHVDCDSLRNLLSRNEYGSTLVSIQFANNEIGTIQDIQKIANIVHEYGGTLHTDATQAAFHIPIDVEVLGIDMMSCSGHKTSPVLKGVGFLYKRNGVDIKPLIYGSQENGLRGGTENTYGILGLNKAIEHCDISSKKIIDLINKRYYFMELLVRKFDCKVNGDIDNRLPNNINVTFPQNITGESLLYMLDMADVKISIGSACNSKSIEPSHVLKVIGLSDDDAMKTVRFTLPDDIAYEEIDNVIEEISKAIKLIELN